MPVLRVLRRRLPDAQIYWWIEASLAPLFEGDPDLTGFLFRRKGWRTFAWWRDVWNRSGRFAITTSISSDLQGLSRSASFSWLADGEATPIGLDNAREGNREGAQIFYDLLAARFPGTPPARRYLGALEPLSLPLLWDFRVAARACRSRGNRAKADIIAPSLPGEVRETASGDHPGGSQRRSSFSLGHALTRRALAQQTLARRVLRRRSIVWQQHFRKFALRSSALRVTRRWPT